MVHANANLTQVLPVRPSHAFNTVVPCTLQRSSNEADPDAAPDQCLLSVCLLLAALFDQSPYGEGTEHRRAIFADFSILKRDFRDDEASFGLLPVSNPACIVWCQISFGKITANRLGKEDLAACLGWWLGSEQHAYIQ